MFVKQNKGKNVMSLFVIDEKLCNQDGICADVCPLKIIEFTENNYPFPGKAAKKMCIGCGHCVTVCPKKAIENIKIEAQKCTPIDKKLILTPEQVEHYIRFRRSTRAYKSSNVDPKIIEKIINVAAHAPSAHNSQQVHWKVMSGQDNIRKMVEKTIEWMNNLLKDSGRFEGSATLKHCVRSWGKGIDLVCRNAPHVIIVHSPKTAPSGSTDCTIALTHLDLIAPSFGLGTCWAGILNMAVLLWPKMKEVLALPDGHKYHGAMILGYPKYQYQSMPPRNSANITWD
jgi:nitroreductase/NAD-dependent dihydropyrimidine dehydrogenase PreA subunit